jgi:hypothetical protein
MKMADLGDGSLVCKDHDGAPFECRTNILDGKVETALQMDSGKHTFSFANENKDIKFGMHEWAWHGACSPVDDFARLYKVWQANLHYRQISNIN